MTTVRLNRKTVSTTEAVTLALAPNLFFAPPEVPKEILEENKLIHHMLGADNTEETWFTLANGWTIRGIPDIWKDNKIVEIKVIRPGTNKEFQFAKAAYQAMTYALAEKIENIEVWLYHYTTGEVEVYPFTVDELQPARFFSVIEQTLNAFTRLPIFKPQLDLRPTNKLSMRTLKVRD